MVQFLLGRAKPRQVFAIIWIMLFLFTPLCAASKRAEQTEVRPPDLLMEGNRKLTFERTFSSERDVRGKPGFWTKVINFAIGEPDYKAMVRPYDIAVDSRGRAIVTDPGAGGVHIFDFARHKYKFIDRSDKGKDAMRAPQCVAVDDKDNIYVTDSDSGKVFVFNANGKYERAIGSLRGGEGFFKRPTGIAVDSKAQRIYVTDTIRNKIFVLDMQGHVLKTIGQTGRGKDDFYFPTELDLVDNNLVVVDAMNFRIKIVNRDGEYVGSFGKYGDALGYLFRPKGIATDSEHHYYVVEGVAGIVQVFDGEGHLLYYFGKRGNGLGEFQLPSGIAIDRNDRIFVVDSYNRRVQVFHYYGVSKSAGGGTH
jgi:DNA-binding beta-propeller fold protein YncE